MLNASFNNLKSILCLGAHSDDIEIGCGGTILKLLAEHPDVDVHWVVLGAKEERAEEAVRSAESFLRNAGHKNVVVRGFRDSFFPAEWPSIKTFFHELSDSVSPDIIFTHRRDDAHQDHRVVSELTWCAFRNHLILEYEIPKYEGDLGTPNIFVPLSETDCRCKVQAITDSFDTQSEKRWFTDDTFWSLLRIRGLESNSPSRFSEAFHCRKLII